MDFIYKLINKHKLVEGVFIQVLGYIFFYRWDKIYIKMIELKNRGG